MVCSLRSLRHRIYKAIDNDKIITHFNSRQLTETVLLAEPEKLWSPWKLQNEELIAGKKDALSLSLFDQLRAGIDIVSDGEQTRQHFVTTFIEHLSGVDFEKREVVKIRNRYDASVPTVVGAVERQKPVFVEDARFLRQLTSQPIKWALPGPMTMIDTLYDNHYKSREKLAWNLRRYLIRKPGSWRPPASTLFSLMSQPLMCFLMRLMIGASRP